MKKLFAKSLIILSIFAFSQPIFAQQYQPLAIKKHNEGVIYYNKKQYDNAIDCFIEAIAADPSFIDSYYNLAVLYEYRGETSKALTAYKKLLNLDNYNPEAAYKIAEIYSKQRNYKVALNYINLVPQNSPRYHSAMDLKAELTDTVAHEKEQCNFAMTLKSTIYKGIPSPAGVAKDVNGNLYIANFAANSITIITPQNRKKTLYKGAALSGPTAIAVDGYNNVYVACNKSGKVVLVSQDHTCKTVLKGLNRPSGLFLDAENNLYVSEQGKNSVIKYKLY